MSGLILDDLGCLTVPPMLLESITYTRFAICHGRGRGFEPRRPRQILNSLAVCVAKFKALKTHYMRTAPERPLIGAVLVCLLPVVADQEGVNVLSSESRGSGLNKPDIDPSAVRLMCISPCV
jgi:hypothetical protein